MRLGPRLAPEGSVAYAPLSATETRQPMDRNYSSALAVMTLIASSCKGPVPPSPAELAKSAAKARAAAAAAAESSSPPAQPPPNRPVLTLQEFSDQVPSALCSPAPGGSCALDRVGQVESRDVWVVKRDEETLLIGWAADGETGTVPPVVLVQLTRAGDVKAEEKQAPASKAATRTPESKRAGNAFFAPAIRLTPRPDVAEVLKTPAFFDAGYDLLASFKNVPAGEYVINIQQVTSVGKALVCDTRRKLKIE